MNEHCLFYFSARCRTSLTKFDITGSFLNQEAFMSDNTTTVSKLAVIATIKEGIIIGTKNIGPIVVNVLLWILTIWIPYLNVGTTIGLMVGIVTKASRGETISMTEIFDPQYRKYMGEYFLTAGLVGVGVGAGAIFLIIPGYVIALAWSLAILLVIDKGKNPTEAITLSNNLTYGYKGKIFWIQLLSGLMLCIVATLLGLIPEVGILLVCIAAFLYMFVAIGIQASIYKQLTEGV